jgi:hypothetical protein
MDEASCNRVDSIPLVIFSRLTKYRCLILAALLRVNSGSDSAHEGVSEGMMDIAVKMYLSSNLCGERKESATSISMKVAVKRCLNGANQCPEK